MANKRQAFTLSYVSFIQFILIGILTTYLLVNETTFNFMSEPLKCIKVMSVFVFILTTVMYSLDCYYSESFELKIQATSIIKTFLFMILFCLLSHFIAILFGAPFFEKTAETFHFALLMTTLVALPCCLVCGSSLEDFLDIFTQQRGANIETVVNFSTIGALIGSWFGAVPIPLDWDRPWQEWPITCCVGAIIGYCGGLLLASLYLPRRYNQLNKSKRS